MSASRNCCSARNLRSAEEILEDLRKAVVSYDRDLAIRVAEEALSSGIDPLRAMEEGLAKGITEIGCKFGTEVFLSDLMMAADAMKAGVAVLERGMKTEGGGRSAGTVVIGTVKGDIHDIGKNLVSTMLAVNGFKVMDLGVDVPSETFIHKAEEGSANIIAVSSLLSTTIANMQELIHLMRDLGCRDRYKVLVGGGQVTPEFAKEIGADGYGEEAMQASAIAKQLLAK
jgi:corrinoid protein of di/trimethylamine methyltransferase